MLKITIDKEQENPCPVEIDAESLDVLNDDILSLAYTLVSVIAKTADGSAEKLQRALMAKSMLEMGSQYAIDKLTGVID